MSAQSVVEAMRVCGGFLTISCAGDRLPNPLLDIVGNCRRSLLKLVVSLMGLCNFTTLSCLIGELGSPKAPRGRYTCEKAS